MNISSTAAVPAGGRVVIKPEDALAFPNNYAGMLRVSSTSSIAVVGLQKFINQGFGALAIDPFDESLPQAQLVFPHLAVGGGYRIELYFFKATNALDSSSVLRFFAPSGAA